MEKSIIEHMACITEKMRFENTNSRTIRTGIDLSPENLERAEEDIAAIRSALGMNTRQVLIMTAVLQYSYHSSIDSDDIACFLGLNYIQFLMWSDDLNELKHRGYLFLKRDGDVVLRIQI